MRLTILGGTGLLSRAVAEIALARGHQVTTVTRGLSGEPPAGAVARRADRDDVDALTRAVGGDVPDAVVDTSGYAVAGALAAAEVFAEAPAYVYVSSISAYRGWPPGPVSSEADPVWGPDDDVADYGPMKAESERVLAGRLAARPLLVRAGLIIGPGDTTRRLTTWLHRIATSVEVAVPADLDQPVAFVDARDLAAFVLDGVEQGWSGPVNATAPVGTGTIGDRAHPVNATAPVSATAPVGADTFGSLLEACREAVRRRGGAPARLVPVPQERLLAAGVEPWRDLPFWLPREVARTAWQVDTARAQALGLAVRPLAESVEDAWRWVLASGFEHPVTSDGGPELPPAVRALLEG